ncbi:MAG: hypothetical protein KC416_13685 [Myxococcales bacterium]|nr:hypothetical protein [Myxococcales bacterium]
MSSVGGHLDEVMKLEPIFADLEVHLVVNDRCQYPAFPFASIHRIVHAERDWRVLLNFAEAARILAEVKPDVILSTGAGPLIPFAILARLLSPARVVFLESAAAVEKPTLTGRMVYPFAHEVFYQWPTLEKHFRKGHLAHVVFP